MRRLLAALACLTALAAAAVEPTPGVLGVASYQGADRMEKLIAGAKKEGELLLYSSLTQEDQLQIAADFRKKYGVTLRFWRGSQSNILQRVTSEARAGRFEFDVIETNAPQLEAIAREGLLQRMDSPLAEQELLPETVPAHREWMPDRLNLVVYAYNTSAVKRSELPKAWPDLLGARWKDRIGMESTNVEWFAAVVDSMGEEAGLEQFRRMGDNGVAVRTGHTASTGRVIAGEIPLMMGVYSHDVDRMKAKGAPIDWFVLAPAVILPSAVAISRRAPHPHAAALFYDYLLTDGQRLYPGMFRVPANKSFESPVRTLVERGQAYTIVDAKRGVDDYDKWQRLYKKLIVDRSTH